MTPQWRTISEWTRYALCADDPRFLTAPEKMCDDDVQDVVATCYKCPVRAECILEATTPFEYVEISRGGQVVSVEASGVWCASTWIPEVDLGDSTRRANQILEEAADIRLQLAKTVQAELGRRGEF